MVTKAAQRMMVHIWATHKGHLNIHREDGHEILVPEEDYGIEFFDEPEWDQPNVPEAALEGIFADGPEDDDFFICGLDDPDEAPNTCKPTTALLPLTVSMHLTTGTATAAADVGLPAATAATTAATAAATTATTAASALPNERSGCSNHVRRQSGRHRCHATSSADASAPRRGDRQEASLGKDVEELLHIQGTGHGAPTEVGGEFPDEPHISRPP